MSMSLYWTKAARSMAKYQLGLMLALVSSSVIPSPVQAGLDEKSEVLAKWLTLRSRASQISPRLLNGQLRQ